ncbi:MAG: hypothetical protein B0D92_05925 [Spirochaeta sp. LUC14_002_19_P3]|nr:MAG: hypothetical protein B0D92_05925 [Spirochaeta sp. LUC14_002_19_P3]
MLGVFLCLLALIPSCSKARTNAELAKRLMELGGDEHESIVRYKSKIRAADAKVEKTIEAVRDSGTYWRLLGLKFMDYQMWGKALEAFDEAIKIEPEHAVLLYKRALCAGQMALSMANYSDRMNFIGQAESGYRRVLDIDSRYTPAMYALAVILVFEKNNPFEAVRLLEDYLSIERSDIPGRFLLARSYMEADQIDEAQRVYGEIVQKARSDADKQKAEDLSRRIAEGNYGF